MKFVSEKKNDSKKKEDEFPKKNQKKPRAIF